MADLDDRLDGVLDCWVVAPLKGDLAGRILARAASEDRALDVLLEAANPRPTLDRDLTDSVLARARFEEAALDRLLEAAESAPRLGRDLTGPVLQSVRRRRLGARIVALAGSLAAAAAIAIVYAIFQGGGVPAGPPTSQGPGPEPSQVAVAGIPAETPQLSEEDQLVVTNMDLVRDWAVYKHWDTIRAMEQLEGEAQMGDRL